MKYTMTIAGLQRDLPLCPIADDLYIAAFICFGDAEISTACATELLKLVPREDYDYIFTDDIINIKDRVSRAERERICVLAKAGFRRNTLCIPRKADAARAQIVREAPMAGGSVFA